MDHSYKPFPTSLRRYKSLLGLGFPWSLRRPSIPPYRMKPKFVEVIVCPARGDTFTDPWLDNFNHAYGCGILSDCWGPYKILSETYILVKSARSFVVNPFFVSKFAISIHLEIFLDFSNQMTSSSSDSYRGGLTLYPYATLSFLVKLTVNSRGTEMPDEDDIPTYTSALKHKSSPRHLTSSVSTSHV